MKPCVYCGLEIDESAIVCKYCTRQIPKGAVSLEYPGHRFGLGRTETGYALWDLTSSTPPLAEFELTPDGFNDAWYRFEQMEEDAERSEVTAPIVVDADPIYPRFPLGPQEPDTDAGRGFTIAAWCCAGLAVLLPIVFGPIGVILGAVAGNRGDRLGKFAIFGALGGMLVGFVITYVRIRAGAPPPVPTV